jgi:hypothetical protein
MQTWQTTQRCPSLRRSCSSHCAHHAVLHAPRSPVFRSQQRRFGTLRCCAASVAGSEGTPTNVGFNPARRQRSNWPNFFLSREEAVQVQLQVASVHAMRADSPFVYFDVHILDVDVGTSVTTMA